METPWTGATPLTDLLTGKQYLTRRRALRDPAALGRPPLPLGQRLTGAVCTQGQRRSPPRPDRVLGPRGRPQLGETQMKLVIGIVRPEKTNEVLEALYRAEVRGFSMSTVPGPRRGARPRGDLPRHDRPGRADREGALRDRRLRRVRRRDDRRRCRTGGHTGEVGDGKIFVLDLEQVVRIRSGETDNAAVTPVVAHDRHRRYRLDADGDRAGAADDARARALLRRPGAVQEHAEHLHDVRRRAGDRDDHAGR